MTQVKRVTPMASLARAASHSKGIPYEQLPTARKMWAAGESVRAIADAIGWPRSVATLRRNIDKLGFAKPVRKPSRAKVQPASPHEVER